MDFFCLYKSGYLLRIKLAPKSANCGLRGTFVDENGNAYLKISVNAVPEKGKANKELLKFLAKTLKISAQSMEIISGATEHNKKIYLDIAPNESMTDKLQKLNQDTHNDSTNS